MTKPRVNWMIRLAGVLRALGPYGVIELVVPGGSLVVLSLWAIRHRSSLGAFAGRAFGRLRHSPSPHSPRDVP